jgi:hypothetical protein
MADAVKRDANGSGGPLLGGAMAACPWSQGGARARATSNKKKKSQGGRVLLAFFFFPLLLLGASSMRRGLKARSDGGSEAGEQ